MSCGTHDDPTCFGRFGWGSGFHFPELAEDQRITGEDDSRGYCSRTCPHVAECGHATTVIEGISVDDPVLLAVVNRNIHAGQVARAALAGLVEAGV